MEISELPLYLKDNLLEDLTIKTLAKKCYSNPTTLKMVFKQKFGEPICSYIIRMRMYAAADKLASGRYLNVKLVGQEVGYTNMSNFAKRFQLFFGHSPSDCFVRKERQHFAKETDIHTSSNVLCELLKNCPEKLKNDFVNHFGKPISAFILESKTASF